MRALPDSFHANLITRHEVRTYLAITVVPKSESLVEGAKPGPRSVAVKPEVGPTELSGSFDSPSEQERGDAPASGGPPHGQPMHENSFGGW